jgi:hypothetical protein
MSVKEWAVWTEGYAATGESGTAVFEGYWWGETFNDACQAWADADAARARLFRPGTKDRPPSYWSCRMFNKEEDARRAFG